MTQRTIQLPPGFEHLLAPRRQGGNNPFVDSYVRQDGQAPRKSHEQMIREQETQALAQIDKLLSKDFFSLRQTEMSKYFSGLSFKKGLAEVIARAAVQNEGSAYMQLNFVAKADDPAFVQARDEMIREYPIIKDIEPYKPVIGQGLIVKLNRKAPSV